jgi:hypothetical protein
MLSLFCVSTISLCGQLTWNMNLRFQKLAGCIEISNSFCNGVVGEGSSAVTSAHGNLTVTTTTFYKCIPASVTWGGAIAKFPSGHLAIAFCCFRECSADRGFAVASASSDGTKISVSTFVLCGRESFAAGRATLYQSVGMVSTYDNINLSSNYVNAGPDTVSAFESSSDVGHVEDHWTFSHSTFWNCTGCSIVYSGTHLSCDHRLQLPFL